MAITKSKPRPVSSLERKSLRARQRMGLEETIESPQAPLPGLGRTLEVVKGDTGLEGPQGEIGSKGERGDRGDRGDIGQIGRRGEKGSRGDRGERGSTGVAGFKGDRGEIGSIGETGSVGEIGTRGLEGKQGPTGVKGDVGVPGDTGTQGTTGKDGDTGSPGAIGKRGVTGIAGIMGIPGSRGDRGLVGDKGSKGEQGPKGVQGVKGERGSKGERGLEGGLSDDDRVRFFVGLQRAKYTDAEAAAALLVLVTKASDYTIVSADNVILCNASAGAFTITLPTAVGRSGKMYNIKKIDSTSNIVTVDGDGTETIDDGLTADLTVQYESITVVSDGTEWWIL